MMMMTTATLDTTLLNQAPVADTAVLLPPASVNALAPERHTSLPPISATEAREPLMGKTLEELKALAVELGHPAFRGQQLHHWLYVFCVREFEAMTNLSKAFREQLAERYCIGTLEIVSRQRSNDGTHKYLFKLADGNVIESVLMHYEERDNYAMCVSTQVGCAVGCSFCATGKLGLKRHLSVSEIVEQYVLLQSDSGKEIRNVVFMGQGEPLHNYQNTVKALRILNASAEVGMRRMTVSTSGIVPQIDALAAEGLPITLAVSLHAPDNDTRTQIMPVNKRWPLEALMPALHKYYKATNRRLTMEYIMIDGVNDTQEHAHKLGKLLHGLHCNINLIPYNPISTSLPGVPDYKRSKRESIRAFQTILTEQYKRKVTVRLERGADIDAACGQLANRYHEGKAV